eukprot:COSAG05_NODE_16910_length_336_cov_0.654008_1_plen_84_part_01
MGTRIVTARQSTRGACQFSPNQALLATQFFGGAARNSGPAPALPATAPCVANVLMVALVLDQQPEEALVRLPPHPEQGRKAKSS